MSCGRTIDILQVDISFDTEIRVQFVLEADFRVNIYMAAFKRQSPPPPSPPPPPSHPQSEAGAWHSASE